MFATRQLLTATTVLLLATTAGARNPVVVQLTDGKNAGPSGDNQGPGAEQSDIIHSVIGGHHYLTTVWMSSQVQAQGDANYQCKCATVEMDPLTGPRVVVPPTQITTNNGGGDRPCNHPRMALNDLTGQILWSYGSDDGNGNNVQPYVQGMDAMCNLTTNRLRIGNNNGNDGAVHVQTINPAAGLFMVGYLENNQRARAVGISLPEGATTLASNTTDNNNHPLGGNILYNKNIIDPANIGRPSIATFDSGHAILCSSNGNNRPPEIGVACAMVDAQNGSKTWTTGEA